MNKVFRYQGCEVSHLPGGFRVKDVRTQQIRGVGLRVRTGKRTVGCCSCGSAAAELPIFQCRHQQAAHALLNQEYLDRLARTGLFPHPERLTLEFERSQRRLLSALRRAMRAGPPPCPHCGRTITAEDLEGTRHRRACPGGAND